MHNIIKKMFQHGTVTVDYPKKPIKSSYITGVPEFYYTKCKRCSKCINSCPTGAIALVDNDKQKEKSPAVNIDECIFCRFCEDACPNKAVLLSNKFELAQKSRAALRATPLLVQDDVVKDLDYELLGRQLKEKVKKFYGKSLNIREVDAGSCNGCDYELNALGSPYNDLERLGIQFVASPRHADMLMVTGCVTRNMEEALIKTYNATPSPKLVIAVGACACSGGIFKNSYAGRNGVDCVLPVDVYIPGCPPRPQALIYGILKAIGRL
ncbi:NADH-quinone oxidoreductase subunit NuoB [Ruminiclostridium herbifermentans]|uniref:NADH-quinone oxidoreductase subunit NuoB n=1 Tax=Ruminiclostridium herbifermentans TaxID=2488810 RepID=A0A4U7JIV3_9FIRM|nr:NADH-quinone oxidoreductase subunit NuoB [Ruminiclostridium herbifermentans]QNU65281.1 NADH-quinone oxidoreductase subunit NuoB [Ruminiclostridium herbifermentans]